MLLIVDLHALVRCSRYPIPFSPRTPRPHLNYASHSVHWLGNDAKPTLASHQIFSLPLMMMGMSMPCLGGQAPLTLGQDSRLPTDLRQTANYHLVTAHKPVQRVRDPDLVTKLLHELLRPPQVMSRDSRVQVMDSLELQPAVDEIQPLRAVHIHRRPQHLLREGLVGTEVGGGHGKVRQGDLQMQGRGYGVGN